ncbi:UNVERIFIED_ORG: hypothetical protein ABIB63_001745 [Xanthomonas axonopodis]
MLADFFPDADPRQLRLVSRIVVDLIYATVELLFDVRLSSRAVAETVGTMIAGHVEQLRDATADVPKGSAAEHRRRASQARRSTRAG